MPYDLDSTLHRIGKSYFVVNFYAGLHRHRISKAEIPNCAFVGHASYTPNSSATKRSGVQAIFKAGDECTAIDRCLESTPADLERGQKLGIKGETILEMAKSIKFTHCRK